MTTEKLNKSLRRLFVLEDWLQDHETNYLDEKYQHVSNEAESLMNEIRVNDEIIAERHRLNKEV